MVNISLFDGLAPSSPTTGNCITQAIVNRLETVVFQVSVPNKWVATFTRKPLDRGAIITLQGRHYGHDGVSNHQTHDCLLNRLFRRRSKKTSKLPVTGFCGGNSPVTGKFPAQRAGNAENVIMTCVMPGCKDIRVCGCCCVLYIRILYTHLTTRLYSSCQGQAYVDCATLCDVQQVLNDVFIICEPGQSEMIFFLPVCCNFAVAVAAGRLETARIFRIDFSYLCNEV